MTVFKNKKQSPYTVIIGCGRLGANLANTLSEEGENVLILFYFRICEVIKWSRAPNDPGLSSAPPYGTSVLRPPLW